MIHSITQFEGLWNEFLSLIKVGQLQIEPNKTDKRPIYIAHYPAEPMARECKKQEMANQKFTVNVIEPFWTE